MSALRNCRDNGILTLHLLSYKVEGGGGGGVDVVWGSEVKRGRGVKKDVRDRMPEA